MEGIGSKTKVYFWINAFIREFIATLVSERVKHVVVLGVTFVWIALMLVLDYYSNNM